MLELSMIKKHKPLNWPNLLLSKDKNIDFNGYIGNSILQIY